MVPGLTCDGTHSAWDWADPGGASVSVSVMAMDTAGDAAAEAQGRRVRRVTFSMGGAGARGVPNVGKDRSIRGADRGGSRSTRSVCNGSKISNSGMCFWYNAIVLIESGNGHCSDIFCP